MSFSIEPHSVQYFIGQTEILTIKGSSWAWGALLSPSNSNTQFTIKYITLTNYSNNALVCTFFFNPKIPSLASISEEITVSNLTILPTPSPKVKLLYDEEVSHPLQSGITPFTHIVPPQTSITIDHNAEFTFGTSHCVLVALENIDHQNTSQGTISFGWYENKQH